MGSLKPGATYVYEKVNGVLYAREAGQTERTVVGYDYDPDTLRNLKDLADQMLWAEIFEAAKTNPAIQSALDRVKIVYYLSKDKKLPPDWHPV